MRTKLRAAEMEGGVGQGSAGLGGGSGSLWGGKGRLCAPEERDAGCGRKRAGRGAGAALAGSLDRAAVLRRSFPGARRAEQGADLARNADPKLTREHRQDVPAWFQPEEVRLTPPCPSP